MPNEPIWNRNACDPRNHMGKQVINDPCRTKAIMGCRVGTDTMNFIKIQSRQEELVHAIALYGAAQLLQERT